MNTILGFILLQYTVHSLPLHRNFFEMVQSPALISQLDQDTMKPESQTPALISQLDQDTMKPEFQTPRKIMKKRKMDDVLLQFTRRLSPSTTRFRLPKGTRRRVNKTTTTTPTTTPPTLPTLPVSYTYAHAIFNPFLEKQKLIQKIAEYFNFAQIPTEFVPFYIWYYNVLHDKQAEERRNRVLQYRRHSYSPGYHLRNEILDHTVFPVPEEHQDFYVLVNDLAADTKDPTVLTFPEGVTFYKTTAMEQLLDEILYDDRDDIEGEDEEDNDRLEDSPNIFFTTRPAENTTTVITTTTPEPEPFYNVLNYEDLYQDNAPWISTTVDYYEGLSEYLENYKKKIPSGEDDLTYFF